MIIVCVDALQEMPYISEKYRLQWFPARWQAGILRRGGSSGRLVFEFGGDRYFGYEGLMQLGNGCLQMLDDGSSEADVLMWAAHMCQR